MLYLQILEKKIGYLHLRVHLDLPKMGNLVSFLNQTKILVFGLVCLKHTKLAPFGLV